MNQCTNSHEDVPLSIEKLPTGWAFQLATCGGSSMRRDSIPKGRKTRPIP